MSSGVGTSSPDDGAKARSSSMPRSGDEHAQRRRRPAPAPGSRPAAAGPGASGRRRWPAERRFRGCARSPGRARGWSRCRRRCTGARSSAAPSKRRSSRGVGITGDAAAQLAEHDAVDRAVGVRDEPPRAAGRSRWLRRSRPRSTRRASSRPFTVKSRCPRSVSCASSGSPSRTCAIVTGTKKAGRARSKMWVNRVGHDADDVERPAVQPHGSPDDRRVPIELAHPVVVAEQYHGVASGHLVLGGAEVAPGLGRHAEGGEEVGRHREADPQVRGRPCFPRDAGPHGADCRQARKRPVGVAEVGVVGQRVAAVVLPRAGARA